MTAILTFFSWLTVSTCDAMQFVFQSLLTAYRSRQEMNNTNYIENELSAEQQGQLTLEADVQPCNPTLSVCPSSLLPSYQPIATASSSSSRPILKTLKFNTSSQPPVETDQFIPTAPLSYAIQTRTPTFNRIFRN